MTYTPSELSRLLKQSPENIRLWSIEFARHLTKTAAPDEKGKRRTYTDDDLAVLALVADSKDRGLLFDAIHKALDDGERLIPQTQSSAIVTYQQQLTALQADVANLQTQITEMSQKLHESELARAAAEGREKLLRELLNEANQRLYKGG